MGLGLELSKLDMVMGSLTAIGMAVSFVAGIVIGTISERKRALRDAQIAVAVQDSWEHGGVRDE